MLTEYPVQVSCEPTTAKQLIHTWLLENSFEPANEDGTQYFTHRVQEEPAARSFMYEIKGNVVTLYSFTAHLYAVIVMITLMKIIVNL